MTTFCPTLVPNFSAKRREYWSGGEPGAYGTISVMGLDGKVSAATGATAIRVVATATAALIVARIRLCMGLSPVGALNRAFWS